jgi:putative ABC transport system substrate-binding protein
MNRREFMLVLGATMTAAPPSRAQPKAMPVIGILGLTSPGPYASQMAAFHQGLSETGYIEGQSVAIEYRWARATMIDCPHCSPTSWPARSTRSLQAAAQLEH